MAAQKGSALLMKIGTGSPVSYESIGGMRSTSMTLNDEMVDVTNKDSSRARTLLAQGGVNSMTVSGSGVFTDTASELALKNTFDASSFSLYQFVIPDFGTYSGSFQLTSLEYSGEYNGEVTYSFTFESSGAISFA
jgi:TP901-1 family phage major tail protein